MNEAFQKRLIWLIGPERHVGIFSFFFKNISVFHLSVKVFDLFRSQETVMFNNNLTLHDCKFSFFTSC